MNDRKNSSFKAFELRFSDFIILVTRQFVWFWFLIIVLLLPCYCSLVEGVSTDQETDYESKDECIDQQDYAIVKEDLHETRTIPCLLLELAVASLEAFGAGAVSIAADTTI